MKLTVEPRLNQAISVRAISLLSPVILLLILTGDTIWLQIAVLTMSTFIAHERSALAPLGVIIHSFAIIVCFAILCVAAPFPPFFVILCALLAGATARLTVMGSALRSLGNFTFVPALYLSADAVAPPGSAFSHFLSLLFLLPLGMVPTLVLATVLHNRGRVGSGSTTLYYRRLFLDERRGEAVLSWIPALAAASSVFIAAALVEYLHLERGQWAIWSAASVVTMEFASTRAKFLERCNGAFCGVPIGVLLGLAFPHNEVVYAAAVVFSLLTLVAFGNYVVSFGARSLFVALAITVSGGTIAVAAERAEDVVLGGIVGLTCVSIIGLGARRGKAAEAPPPTGRL